VPKAFIWGVMWHRKRNVVPSTEECARAVRVLGIEITIRMGVIVAWQMSLISVWSVTVRRVLEALMTGGLGVPAQFFFRSAFVRKSISHSRCTMQSAPAMSRSIQPI